MWGISLSQLAPSDVQRIVSFIWVCTFLELEMSTKVFRTLYWLKPYRGTSVKTGWYSLEVGKGGNDTYATSYPVLGSMKKWTQQWLWLRVPLHEKHPHLYQARTEFTRNKPLEKKALSPNALTTDKEIATFQWFQAYGAKAKGKSPTPKNWLPHFDLLKVELYLAAGGLRRRISQSKFLVYL